jgi:hypothetical protein
VLRHGLANSTQDTVPWCEYPNNVFDDEPLEATTLHQFSDRLDDLFEDFPPWIVPPSTQADARKRWTRRATHEGISIREVSHCPTGKVAVLTQM